ncbi:hypothetical protein [Ramlibacter rhizophilus]|uniref:Virulence factor n=1 Tax=Ramlibacter rhizophilus TaxID=1781167 RepID=A0A4Z0C3J8_9BURK|nr:hypothetical protein [Ramlibacter rhizophilus]TFZ04795.1 hypothetical protein EZ242_03325 [Ramlibacter rhizophilus]
MKRPSHVPSFLAAALVLGGLGAASTAHAGPDVSFSVGINVPFGYVQPAPVYGPPPVYVQPAPVYVQPRPVYVQPHPVYVQPAPVYGQPGWGQHFRGGHRGGPWGDADRDGVPNRYDRHWSGRHGHHGHNGRRGDRDGDGVPNRFDRAPHNPYYR